MKDTTPIAIFCYNRPAHTNRLLEALAKCEQLDRCSVHIFSDAAKTSEQTNDVLTVRRLLSDWTDRLDATVIENESNKGLAQSILDGVTALLNEFDRVIVLEDDLVPSPDFIVFMLKALRRYENTPEVFSVSGYSFPISGAGQSDAYFLPIISTWGWATWKRAWQFNDLKAMDAEGLLTNLQLRSRFNLENAYPYSDMLRDRLAGKNSSWGVMWYWSVFRRNGLVLFPRRSLIYNGGYDGSGVHCGKTDDPATVPIHEVLETRIPDPLILPDRLETAESDFQLVRSYLLKMQPASGHGVGTLLRRIKRRLSL